MSDDIQTYYDPEVPISTFPLMKRFVQGWEYLNSDDLEIKPFNEGITNRVFLVQPKAFSRSCANQPISKVLLRFNGNRTENIVNRRREFEFISTLSEVGFGPKIFSRFGNGMIYQFFEGRSVKPNEMVQPEFAEHIARHLSRFHRALEPTSLIDKTSLNDTIRNYFEQTLRILEDRIDTVPSFEVVMEYQKKFELLAQLLESLQPPGSELAVCHNDLLAGNIVVDTSGERHVLHFIDFEYCSLGIPAFDIGNHFMEYSGFAMDLKRLPNRQSTENFLRFYLSETYDIEMDEIPESTVQEWYVQVRISELISLLYWGVWALIQAECSHLSFDYASYALRRFKTFEILKQEIQEELLELNLEL